MSPNLKFCFRHALAGWVLLWLPVNLVFADDILAIPTWLKEIDQTVQTIKDKGFSQVISDAAREKFPSVAGYYGGDVAERAAKTADHMYSIGRQGIDTISLGMNCEGEGCSKQYFKKMDDMTAFLKEREGLMLRDVLPDSVNKALDTVNNGLDTADWLGGKLENAKERIDGVINSVSENLGFSNDEAGIRSKPSSAYNKDNVSSKNESASTSDSAQRYGQPDNGQPSNKGSPTNSAGSQSASTGNSQSDADKLEKSLGFESEETQDNSSSDADQLEASLGLGGGDKRRGKSEDFTSQLENDVNQFNTTEKQRRMQEERDQAARERLAEEARQRAQADAEARAAKEERRAARSARSSDPSQPDSSSWWGTVFKGFATEAAKVYVQKKYGVQPPIPQSMSSSVPDGLSACETRIKIILDSCNATDQSGICETVRASISCLRKAESAASECPENLPTIREMIQSHEETARQVCVR